MDFTPLEFRRFQIVEVCKDKKPISKTGSPSISEGMTIRDGQPSVLLYPIILISLSVTPYSKFPYSFWAVAEKAERGIDISRRDTDNIKAKKLFSFFSPFYLCFCGGIWS